MGVTITDTPPPGVALWLPDDWDCELVGDMRCVLPGSLRPGASVTLDLDADVTCAAADASQPVHNFAVVSSSLADVNPANDMSNLSITVTKAGCP
jgi:Domain of unknown function DUF11